MKKLPYDPADGVRFWEAIRQLPGFPAHETMPIQEMVFESDALFRTTQILQSVGARQDAPLVIVMDETAMRRNQEDLKALLVSTLNREGWQIQTVLMHSDESGQVHTDMPHIREVQTNLSPGCAVLAVGSGVVTDIAKHGCFLYQQETGESVRFVVFQTANSVSAYTSNMAPTFINGVKRTLPSRYPDALVCDLETLCDAPYDMTVAGERARDLLGQLLRPAVVHGHPVPGFGERLGDGASDAAGGAGDEHAAAHRATSRTAVRRRSTSSSFV